MSARHILFHRPTVWGSDVQCSTKVLARSFAGRGCAVSYLQSPLDPVHLLRGRDYLAVWRMAPFEQAGVRIIHPATPVPVRDVWPLNTVTAAALRYRWSMPRLTKAVTEGGRRPPDVVWTTVPGSAGPLRAQFPKARIVFHVVDYYPAFRGRSVRDLERADYAAADDVYVIGARLAEYLTGELGVPRSKVIVLGQGVDLARFDPAVPEPPDLAPLRRPRAVWTGVMRKGDPGLFRAAAETLDRRGGSLALIGPEARWAEHLARAFPGVVRVLGPRPPEVLPAYLMHSDIGLMLYDRGRGEVYRGQNPLKLYEYAAAGLPVISTDHDEFRSLEPPVHVVGAEEEVGPAVAAALANVDRERALALEFARQHDWEAKVRAIEARLFGARPE